MNNQSQLGKIEAFDAIVCTKTQSIFNQSPWTNNNEQLNCKLIHLPALSIKKCRVKKDDLNAVITNLSRINWVVVSSPNSLKLAPAAIIKAMKELRTNIAAVGQTSGDLAKLLGLNLQLISPTQSMAGFFNLPEFVGKNQYLFIKGVGGNEKLIHHLKQVEKQVQVLEVYQRVPIIWSESELDAILDLKNLWLFYSQSALLGAYNNFKNDELRRKWFLAQPVLCLSSPIVELAQSLGFQASVSQMNHFTDSEIFNQIASLTTLDFKGKHKKL